MSSAEEEDVRTRYRVLADRALEGELDDGEAAELAALLRGNAGLRETFRRELALWELWSQASAPERSAEAFLASWRTRLEAEGSGEAFARDWRRRVRSETLDTSSLDRPDAGGARGALGRRRWLPAFGGIAAALALGGLASWLALPNRAEALQRVSGQAVCRKCLLGEPHEHTAALRVRDEHGVEHVCYLLPDNAVPHAYGNFCDKPVPVVVTGIVRREGGCETIEVRRVEPATPSADPKRAPRDFPEKPHR